MTVLALARRAADAAWEVTGVGGFSRLGYEARRSLFHWDAQPAPDLGGQVVLVTGATGGLGFAAADALARRGANLWIVGRDADRTDDARDRIIDATPGATVSVIVADLASLDDVRECAERVTESA